MVTKVFLLLALLFNPNSKYAQMNEEDISKLEHVIQHEVGAFSFNYKENLASLLYNRLESEEFPDTVNDMLYAPNQFHGAKSWAVSSKWEGDLVSKYVIWRVFTFENPSHDGVYYYNPELSDWYACWWFENSGDVELVKSISETSYGITYETRYFKDAKDIS